METMGPTHSEGFLQIRPPSILFAFHVSTQPCPPPGNVILLLHQCPELREDEEEAIPSSHRGHFNVTLGTLCTLSCNDPFSPERLTPLHTEARWRHTQQESGTCLTSIPTVRKLLQRLFWIPESQHHQRVGVPTAGPVGSQ